MNGGVASGGAGAVLCSGGDDEGSGEGEGDGEGDEERGETDDDNDDDDTVLDPTAGFSDSVTSPAQPAATTVIRRNAAVNRWWARRRDIGGSLPRARGCKRARLPGSCFHRDSASVESPRAARVEGA